MSKILVEIAILSQYLASPCAVNAATARCYQHGVARWCQVVTLTAGSKRRSLLMAGDDDEMFMARSFHVTPKITEQHLFVRSDKSVAYVTNNKRLCPSPLSDLTISSPNHYHCIVLIIVLYCCVLLLYLVFTSL